MMPEVTIYTTEFCPFCHAAKQLFESLDTPYREVRLDRDPDLRQQLSAAHNGWRTVPMIFIGETFVGGFQDVMKLHQSGQLTSMLAVAAGG